MICIFCRKESESTDEHIVPEFLGGSLIIRDVCKTCNSKMGSDFEGPLSRAVIFRLPRYLRGIRSKSSSQVDAFPGTGRTEDGAKVKMDSKLKPYILTELEEKKTKSGAIELKVMVDASDKDKILKIIETKIRRIAKREWPDKSTKDVDALVQSAIDSLPAKYETQKIHQPIIEYREDVDLDHLTLLMMKIAYEISFHHYGVDILSDISSEHLRYAIHTRNTETRNPVILFPDLDPFLGVTVPQNNHYVVIFENMCYIKIFNVTALIQISDKKTEYSFKYENHVIYLFDFLNKRWKKERLISYILHAIN